MKDHALHLEGIWHFHCIASHLEPGIGRGVPGEHSLDQTQGLERLREDQTECIVTSLLNSRSRILHFVSNFLAFLENAGEKDEFVAEFVVVGISLTHQVAARIPVIT